MSSDYSPMLVAGITLREIVKSHRQDSTRTVYDHYTGVPKEEEIYTWGWLYKGNFYARSPRYENTIEMLVAALEANFGVPHIECGNNEWFSGDFMGFTLHPESTFEEVQHAYMKAKIILGDETRIHAEVYRSE